MYLLAEYQGRSGRLRLLGAYSTVDEAQRASYLTVWGSLKETVEHAVYGLYTSLGICRVSVRQGAGHFHEDQDAQWVPNK